MIIKKFTAKTEEEATLQAKKELGDGIVIMNVRAVKAKGLFAAFRKKQIEVTVALEEETEKFSAVTRELKPIIDLTAKDDTKTLGSEAKEINERLDSLQALLESQMKNNTNDLKETSNEPEISLKDIIPQEAEEKDSDLMKFEKLLYNTMVDNEVDEKYANQILEEIEKTQKPNAPFDVILAGVYQKMILKFGKAEDIKESENGPKMVTFIGPTGVGKTTTIAKIASQYSVKEQKKCALITMDTYRIAAAEQLRTYANILMVPFRVIYTMEDLNEAMNDFKEYDYIFVDTAGHSHQNLEQLNEMKEFLTKMKELAECQFYLVLSATTKYRDLKKIVDNYSGISDYQLIFTKLDETSTIGNLLNIKLYCGASIAYVTYGQNVPDDIEVFNPQTTVKQLLGGKSSRETENDN